MKRALIAVLAALGLSGFALYSWAQAPHHHPDGELFDAIYDVQAQLGLDTSQQQLWNNAVALSQAAHTAMKANFSQLKAATQTELAKSAPDLASLATLADQLKAQGSAQRLQARTAWLALYDTFSPQQKLTLRDAINARIADMKAHHADRHSSH